MPSIRSLRLSHEMTMVDLALAAGVPARTLGAIEYGLLHLDADCAARLAAIFGLAPDQLCATERHTSTARSPRGHMAGLRRAAPPLAAALISGMLLLQSPLLQRQPVLVVAPAISAPAPSPRPARADDAPPQRSNASSAFAAPSATTAPPTPAPTFAAPSATAPPTPTPAFRLDADGPPGCPLIGAAGPIVVTQGYGVGTHAPAANWGALDLAIDGDGDGGADPSATDGVTIVATHDGVARVYPNSWPGGHFVLLEHAQSGWSTGYAHLASIAVADGQAVVAGTPLGVVGSTGMSTGPHLHYEVRYGGVNQDPSALIACAAPANL